MTEESRTPTTSTTKADIQSWLKKNGKDFIFVFL
jgi:hypothetical protein